MHVRAKIQFKNKFENDTSKMADIFSRSQCVKWIHNFYTEQKQTTHQATHQNMQISVLDGALWDMKQARCWICEIGLCPD